MINAPRAEGAIGTAKWTGVSLKKVIKYCGGLKDGAKHLELYGADTYFKGGHDVVFCEKALWRWYRVGSICTFSSRRESITSYLQVSTLSRTQ